MLPARYVVAAAYAPRSTSVAVKATSASGCTVQVRSAVIASLENGGAISSCRAGDVGGSAEPSAASVIVGAPIATGSTKSLPIHDTPATAFTLAAISCSSSRAVVCWSR